MNHEHSPSSTTAWYRSPGGRVLLAALGVAGVYALVQHWEHALPYLPWLLILACPLLHVFMHRGHGGHGGHGGHAGNGGDGQAGRGSGNKPGDPG